MSLFCYLVTFGWCVLEIFLIINGLYWLRGYFTVKIIHKLIQNDVMEYDGIMSVVLVNIVRLL